MSSRYQSIFLGAAVELSALRDVLDRVDIMFDECGNKVERNKEVIELAVYLALGKTLLIKCREHVEFKTVKVVASSQWLVHLHVRHISGFDIKKP